MILYYRKLARVDSCGNCHIRLDKNTVQGYGKVSYSGSLCNNPICTGCAFRESREHGTAPTYGIHRSWFKLYQAAVITAASDS